MQENSTVTLTFKRSELIYDIQNYAFVEADIMQENSGHAQHQTFDITEDGNINRVNRILGLAFADCVELLYPFTKQAVENTMTANDILDYPSEYQMVLSVPSTFAKSTVDVLERYIHEYLVCRILADWFTITKPEAAPAWKARMQEAEESINSAKCSRMRRTRRGMSPF